MENINKGEMMDLEKELRGLNQKYFELYEMLNFCNERFANMHFRIVENSKNIKRSTDMIEKMVNISKLKTKIQAVEEGKK